MEIMYYFNQSYPMHSHNSAYCIIPMSNWFNQFMNFFNGQYGKEYIWMVIQIAQ